MDIQAAVEVRDLSLSDAYNADCYSEGYDASEVIAEIETAYPSINWKPCYEAIEKEAAKTGLEYEEMTDEDIKQIATAASEFLSEQEGCIFDETHPLLQDVKITPLAAYQEATKGLTRISWKEWQAIEARVKALPEGHNDSWDLLKDVADTQKRHKSIGVNCQTRSTFFNRIEELEEVLN